MFQPFERLGAEQTQVEGTGIGLALTRRIVEAMRGTIEFSTREGEGTTFWVDLQAAERATVAPKSVAAKTTTALRPCRVLYIEDEELNRVLVQHILAASSDVDVLLAETGGAGLDLARSAAPDVILLDLDLSDINGIEVLKTLRLEEATRRIPVIALTANASPSDVERGLAAGFNRYLTKPLDPDGLRRTVADVVAEHAAGPSGPVPVRRVG